MTGATASSGADRSERRRIHERDRTMPIRVLVLAERLPLGNTAGFRMVSALAASTSQIRITVAVRTADPVEVEPLGAAGVEVVVGAGASWLSERTAHPTVSVVLGSATAARFDAALRETQPQTAIVYDPTGDAHEDHVTARRAEALLVRRADVVIAPSHAYARFVAELAPSAHAVIAPPGTPDLHAALAEALALTGVALPDAAFD
jgi:ABC-type amino acid transport substrate-binding protein